MTNNDDDDELKNFPEEMGIADEERFTDYTKYDRNPKDSDVMKRIWTIFSHRLFPVISLSYIASVLGISLSRGTHFLFDGTAHAMAMVIMIWVSIAPLTWASMRAMIGEFREQAGIWYIWIAGIQAICGLLFYFMFPDIEDSWFWSLQSFFVASIPIHIVVYFFFMMQTLPPQIVWPLTLAGIVFMLYGLLLI